MGHSKNVLQDFISLKSRYLKPPDGEEIRAKFINAVNIPNHFDNGKTGSVRYCFEVNGEEKSLESVSRDLAIQMSMVEEEEYVFISRKGRGYKTKYTIRKEVK